MADKDFYRTLGVARTATEKEVKAAYRKAARKYHPDVNPDNKDAESRFKEINAAYEVLSDADKRKKYDQFGANWEHGDQMNAQWERARPRGCRRWSSSRRGTWGRRRWRSIRAHYRRRLCVVRGH